MPRKNKGVACPDKLDTRVAYAVFFRPPTRLNAPENQGWPEHAGGMYAQCHHTAHSMAWKMNQPSLLRIQNGESQKRFSHILGRSTCTGSARNGKKRRHACGTFKNRRRTPRRQPTHVRLMTKSRELIFTWSQWTYWHPLKHLHFHTTEVHSTHQHCRVPTAQQCNTGGHNRKR